MNIVINQTKRIAKLSSALLNDESGQSTTEYVLLLLFVVIAVKSVGNTLTTKLKAVIDQIFGRVTSTVNSAGG